jgi:hypothetical protein
MMNPVDYSEMDLVEGCELAGLQLSWLRQRGAGDAGHFIVMAGLNDPERTERGPMPRQHAMLVFEAMRSALIAAARQQTARLRTIIRRAS